MSGVKVIKVKRRSFFGLRGQPNEFRARRLLAWSLPIVELVAAQPFASGCRVPEFAVGASLSTDARPSSSAASSLSSGTASRQRSSGSVGSSQSDSTSEQGSTLACVPGQSRQCDELPNGQSVVFPGGVAQGACARGRRLCNAQGVWGACQGTVAPLSRDSCDKTGDDSNCNGVENEGCLCTAGESPRSCGTDVGACKSGLQYCKNGLWTACVGNVGPAPELCDGKGVDEDCNGFADLKDRVCECTTDQPLVACELAGRQGDCALGAKVCHAGRVSACQPRFNKDTEHCGVPRVDALGAAIGDEDCDGRIDETDSAVEPIGCEQYMIDEDRDGWGKIGQMYPMGGQNSTYGCFCHLPTELAKSGMIPAPSKHRLNRDCADRPGGQDVHPGQSDYFEEPSSALENTWPAWDGGPFDYNCDGVAVGLPMGSKLNDCVPDENQTGCTWSKEHRFWPVDETPACGDWVEVPFCGVGFDWPNTKTCRLDYTYTPKFYYKCR